MDYVRQLTPFSRNPRRFCYVFLLSYMTLCLGADQTVATRLWDESDHDTSRTEVKCGSNIGSSLSCVVNLFYGEGSPCQSGMICCKTMSACPPPLTRIADGIRNDLQYNVPIFWTTSSDLLEKNSTWDFCQMSLDLLKHLIVADLEKEMQGNRVLNTDGDRNSDAFLASLRKENFEAEDADLSHCFSTPEILISPSTLDWGSNYLHVPSFALLTITNTCNHSILTIYEISSTNSEFFAYNFSEISVEPGKYIALPVVFLPICLGLSSAQMVMETSFGGFLIHAQGLTVKSPYKIEPPIGLILSSNRKVRTRLSIYNPFDYVININEALLWSLPIPDDLVLFAHDICGEGTYYTTDKVHSPHFDKSCITRNEHLNEPALKLMPNLKWKASTRTSAAFMDKEPLVHVNGHISRPLCMHFQNSDEHNWSDLARVPIEGKVEKVAYYSPTGLVYVGVEVLRSCQSSKPSSFILSIRNDASHLLRLVKVIEVGGSVELFQVRYWEGLLLYPGATADIAFVIQASIDPVPCPEKIIKMSSGCKLQILINESGGSLVEIPCQDLLRHSCNYYPMNSSLDDCGNSNLEATFQGEITELSNSMTGLLSNIFQVPTPFEVSGVKETEVVLRGWRSLGTSEDMTILKESHIIFPAVQVGDHSSKLVTISNPSQYSVIIQLFLNPKSVVRKCQDLTARLTHPSMEDVDLIDGIRDGFLLSDSAITEVHVPPFGKAFLGPISFRPSSTCEWTSTAYLRNNLSGVEGLSIHGFGGSPFLIFLEGAHTVRSLEFKLNAPIPSSVSWFKLFGRKNQESICTQSLLKELLAKNIGKLPLEVRKIDVSGNGCGSDGFLIHTCEGLSLAPGESKRFLISFQSDYSVPVVRKELVLGLAVGILVIPMTATLPLEVLNICGKSYSGGVLWKILIVVVVSVSLMILFDCIQNPKISECVCGNQSAKCGLGLSVEKFVRLRNDHVSAEQGAATKLMVKMGKKRSRGKRTDVPLGLVEKLEALCGESSKFVPLSPTSPLMLSSTSEKIPEPADCSSECHSPAVINEVEYEKIGNLSVKTNANRRRKKRAYGNSMIKGKFDTSSSQSGNSTPSSPLSPLLSLSHKKTPLSPPDNEQFSGNPPLRKSPQERRRETILKNASTSKLWESEDLRYYGNASSHLSKEQPSFLKKTSAKPALLPSATFPAAGWRSSGTFVSSTMTPLARAPGYQVRKDKLEDGNSVEEKSDGKEDFTYDIWGNHFPVFNMMDKSVKTLTKALDDESLSFFSRDFQV